MHICIYVNAVRNAFLKKSPIKRLFKECPPPEGLLHFTIRGLIEMLKEIPTYKNVPSKGYEKCPIQSLIKSPTRWSTDTVYPEGYRNVPTQQFKERPNLNDQTVPCHFPVPSDTGCAHPRVPLFIT